MSDETNRSPLDMGVLGRRYLPPGESQSRAQGAVPGGVRVGDFVFLSGQCATDSGGQLVGAGNCLAQTQQCFKNISYLLDVAGLDMQSIVKLTCYLTRAADYPAYAQSKREWFPDVLPPGTCVVVHELLLPGALIEIDVVAAARC
jgi:2-iminobutanoate/2-iminopropanoate deaminase